MRLRLLNRCNVSNDRDGFKGVSKTTRRAIRTLSVEIKAKRCLSIFAILSQVHLAVLSHGSQHHLVKLELQEIRETAADLNEPITIEYPQKRTNPQSRFTITLVSSG